MRWLTGFQALAVGLVTLGCSGGDDSAASAPSGLAGMYQATTTTSSEPCDADAMPIASDPPYFQIKDEQTFGESYVAVYPCTSSDPTSCDDFAEIDFATPDGAGFKSEVTGLATDGSAMPTSCSGNYTKSEIKKTGGGVNIVTTTQSGTLNGADLCKLGDGEFTAPQKAAIKALPCTTQTTVDAQRL
jgi:hypothetical protein